MSRSGLGRWGPVFLWAGLIFLLSSIPDHRAVGSELPELMFRKVAHLVEYAVLALLVGRALSGGGKAPQSVLRMGFLFCFLYAVSDEVHQRFVPGRFGKARDVGLDSLGAGLALLLYVRRQQERGTRSCATDPPPPFVR